MTQPTEDAEHGITLEMLEQLGKNRPGRSWIRDNIKLWDDNAEFYEKQAKKLRQMATIGRAVLDANKVETVTNDGGNGE